MKNHIVFKFLAIALCALALLSSVVSGVGIAGLTAAGLYDKTVAQVREDAISAIGKNMAHDVALYYASTELGSCPEGALYRRYGNVSYYANFRSDGYGYTLKDAEGNTLETGGYLTPDSQESFSTYTFPVTGQYLYMVSLAPEQVPEAAESELLAEPLVYADDETYIYNAIPDSGATAYFVTLWDAFGNVLYNLGSPDGLGTIICNAQGDVIFRSFDIQDAPLESVYQAEFQDSNGNILYDGYSTSPLGELTLSSNGTLIYTGQMHPERDALTETVPETTPETIPETTPETAPQETAAETAPETAAGEETQPVEGETAAAEETTEETALSQEEQAPSSASAMPEEGETAPETTAAEETAAPDETAASEATAATVVTEPVTEPVVETTVATVPEETLSTVIIPLEPDLNQLINGKPLREYEIIRISYWDEEIQQEMVAQCVYLPMEEMTLELYVTPNGLYDDGMYQLLDLVRTFRSDLFLILGTSLLVFAILAVYLCCAAGRKPKTAEVQAGGLNRLPLDLYLALTALSIGGIVVVGAELANNMLYWQLNLLVFCAGAAGMGYLACLIFVGFCFAFVAQIKTPGGYWWRNSLCGRILGLAGKLLHRMKDLLIPGMIGLLRKGWQGLTGFLGRLIHRWMLLIPLVWQWLAAEAAIFLLICVGVAARSFLFTLLCLVGAVVLIVYGAGCYGKLWESARRMSQGDLSAKVDDTNMVGAFRDFAQDLNKLSGVAMEAAQQQLKSERMKTELITNVSHDIKTPLTSIINYVDLLQKPHTLEEGEAYLEVLQRQSQRLKKLIEDLMDMSKASTGNMTVEIALVDAVESVNQALGEFADKLEKAQLTPLLRCSEPSMMMMADGKLVWRVLSNLLTNAVKYALPGTRLYVDLMQTEGKVIISLKNISREELNIDADELMERFVRGDDSRNTEGSGLGLNIAKSLMELQHGQLQLLVDGDLFKVTLIFPGV